MTTHSIADAPPAHAAMKIEQMRGKDELRVETGLAIPPRQDINRGPKTAFGRAIAKLADPATPIGASFFHGGKYHGQSATAYGLGWTAVRAVEEGGIKGHRIWKAHPAPGRGNRVPGTQAPVVRKPRAGE